MCFWYASVRARFPKIPIGVFHFLQIDPGPGRTEGDTPTGRQELFVWKRTFFLMNGCFLVLLFVSFARNFFCFFLFPYLAVSNARLARARVTTHGRGEPWYAGRFRDSGINASPFLLSRAHFRVPELCGRRRRGKNKQVPGDVTTEQIKGQQHVSSRKTRWCYINRKENKKKERKKDSAPELAEILPP